MYIYIYGWIRKWLFTESAEIPEYGFRVTPYGFQHIPSRRYTRQRTV